MGWLDGFAGTVPLLKQTLDVVRRNPEILRPTYRQFFWTGLFTVLLILGIWGLFLSLFNPNPVFGGLLLVVLGISLIGLVLVLPFLKTYYRAGQVWMIYQTFAGKPVTFAQGMQRAKENRMDVFIFTIVEMIANFISARLKQGVQGKGIIVIILSAIMWILGKVVEEGWDLISHYLLPAAVIEDKSVDQILPRIKDIKDHVPAALVGVFGIDLVGDVIGGMFMILLFLATIAGVIIGLFTGQLWFVGLVIILFILVASAYGIVVDMIKTIYFTLLYISITRPIDIAKEYRAEVTQYLKAPTQMTHGGNTSVSAPAQAPPKGAARKEWMATQVETLKPYIARYREQGYSPKEIRGFLIESGWPEEAVDAALKSKK